MPRGRNRCNPPAHRCAFSLLELVIILVTIALLSAIAVPRYADALVRYRVNLAADRVMRDLQWAAAHAKATGADVVLAFDLADNAYTSAELDDPDQPGSGYAVALGEPPYEAAITAADFAGSAQVTFNGYGTPSASGFIAVTVGDRTQKVTLDAATGEVSIP